MSLRHLYLDLNSLNLSPDISIKENSAYGYIKITSSSIILRKEIDSEMYQIFSDKANLIKIYTPMDKYGINTRLPTLSRDVVHNEIKLWKGSKCSCGCYTVSMIVKNIKFTRRSIMNIFRNIHKIKSVDDIINESKTFISRFSFHEHIS